MKTPVLAAKRQGRAFIFKIARDYRVAYICG
jgi:hypothetical protein